MDYSNLLSCPICYGDFDCDVTLFPTDEEKRLSCLPVLSHQCPHKICASCLNNWQLAAISEQKSAKAKPPKWFKCHTCKEKTAFNAEEIKVDLYACGAIAGLKAVGSTASESQPRALKRELEYDVDTDDEEDGFASVERIFGEGAARRRMPRFDSSSSAWKRASDDNIQTLAVTPSITSRLDRKRKFLETALKEGKSAGQLRELIDRDEEMQSVEEFLKTSASRRAANLGRKGRERRVYEDDSDSEDEFADMLGTPTSPSGDFIEDCNFLRHIFRLPEGAHVPYVRRGWVSRMESKLGLCGRKKYAPQVGDSVIYIPKAHYDTLKEYPTSNSATVPWKSWPQSSAWPVVRCTVKAIRYRFPYEQYFLARRGSEPLTSIVAILKLEVTGIPLLSSDGTFPWLEPQFVSRQAHSSSIIFEVSVFENGQVDFIVPEHLYTWKIKSLQEAISSRRNAHGLQYSCYFQPSAEDEGGDVEDAEYTPWGGEISGMVFSRREREMHFKNSGYNAVAIVWENGDRAQVSAWEGLLTEKIGDVPLLPCLDDDEKSELIGILDKIEKEDDVKQWFSHPVDTSLFIDYLRLVEVPMDLSIIRTRLENDYYTNMLSFEADVKLIRENCNKYNGRNADITQIAYDLYDKVVEMCSDLDLKTKLEQVGVRSRVEIYWPLDKIHYPATIIAKHEGCPHTYTFLYDDGERESFDLSKHQQFKILDDAVPKAALDAIAAASNTQPNAPAPIEQQTNALFDDPDDFDDSDDSDGDMFTGGELHVPANGDDDDDDAKEPPAPKPRHHNEESDEDEAASLYDAVDADSNEESDKELQPAKKRKNEGDDEQVKKQMRVAGSTRGKVSHKLCPYPCCLSSNLARFVCNNKSIDTANIPRIDGPNSAVNYHRDQFTSRGLGMTDRNAYRALLRNIRKHFEKELMPGKSHLPHYQIHFNNVPDVIMAKLEKVGDKKDWRTLREYYNTAALRFGEDPIH